MFHDKVYNYRIKTIFNEKNDTKDCILEIHAGAGGVDSQDWASMLMRMYCKWANKKKYTVKEIDITGDDIGVKSATIEIKGPNTYGWLKNETGIHRLIRKSPFNANNKRQTSFACVSIYPVIDDSKTDTISTNELHIESFRSSGKGGQHVNCTDSAIRVTHIPTGISAQCQNERSQHQNKEMAIKLLKFKIFTIKQKQEQQLRQEEYQQKSDISWGHQVRSYTLHPYQLIKDHDTKVESKKITEVLNGNIDPFLIGHKKISHIKQA